MRVIDVNRSTMHKLVLARWEEAFKVVLSKTHQGEGPLAITEEFKNELISDYETILKVLEKKEGRAELVPAIKAWLEKMGIDVKTETINDILDRSQFHGGRKNPYLFVGPSTGVGPTRLRLRWY